MKTRSIEYARDYVAKLAETEGELTFAREVRAGYWDERNDVQRALVEDFQPRRLVNDYYHVGGKRCG